MPAPINGTRAVLMLPSACVPDLLVPEERRRPNKLGAPDWRFGAGGGLRLGAGVSAGCLALLPRVAPGVFTRRFAVELARLVAAAALANETA